MRFFLFFILSGNVTEAQTYLYTLGNDSVLVDASKKITFIYSTNRSCHECFYIINDYLRSDTLINYYFVIEKNLSPISNYETYKTFIAGGINKKHLFFAKTITQEISPFIKVFVNKKETYVPYSEIFENKETMSLSKKLIDIISN